ncbi:MAG: type II secretion system protein [Burkholderiales bacterium]
MFAPDPAAARARSEISRIPGPRQGGISLIELILFVVIVAIGVAALLQVFSTTVRKSADPILRKQMLSIAEALMEEIQAKPFTYCDPDDFNAATAGAALVGAGNCQATVEAIGPDGGESRYSAATPFDNVNDYHGFDSNTAAPAGIRDLSGAAITGLAGYRARVSIATQALGPAGLEVPAIDVNGAPQSLVITITVNGLGNESLVLQGHRTRFAPNSL